MDKYNAMQQEEAFNEYLQSADCESEVIIPATQLEFKIFQIMTLFRNQVFNNLIFPILHSILPP